MNRVFYCQSDPSTKIEDENFCRVDKVTDRSKCELMGSRLLVIGHMSREILIRLGELKVQEGVFGSSAVRKDQKLDVKWRYWIVLEYVF